MTTEIWIGFRKGTGKEGIESGEGRCGIAVNAGMGRM